MVFFFSLHSQNSRMKAERSARRFVVAAIVCLHQPVSRRCRSSFFQVLLFMDSEEEGCKFIHAPHTTKTITKLLFSVVELSSVVRF